MRILHTSDWHIGATFGERSRLDAHAHFLDWLLDAITAHQVDVLVVAGDVFDTSNPPAEALALYYRFLARLAALPAGTASGGRRATVIVGGNHDSPARLDAPREALAALDAHVVGGYDANRDGQPHATSAGELVALRGASGVELVVAAVPFLNDWRIGVRGFESTAAEQLDDMHTRFGQVYRELADKAEAAFPGVPLMATGHLTCLPQRGARVSEDDAVPFEINRVGTLGAMAPTIFDERYRYVALGHIHRGFAVDAEARIRYSGTPLQISAVEGADSRQVLLVDVDARSVERRALPVPARQRLLRLAGPLDSVLERLAALTIREGELPALVTVDLELETPDATAEAKLRSTLEARRDAPFELVGVRATVRRRASDAHGLDVAATLDALTPESAFLHAWRSKHGADASPPEGVMSRLRSLLEQRASEEGSTP
jgi:exonuclease SbcD